MQNLKTTAKDKVSKYLRRKTKVNATIKASHPDFRIVINKSNKYIKAQLLDKMGTVLAYVSDKDSNGETKSQKAQNA
ncbi:TPA: hypothetical protein DEP21_04690 [Patescibacteria group bacterium]|nr:hypothetical protein [Candidatus Gracilibacteria bacterium]